MATQSGGRRMLSDFARPLVSKTAYQREPREILSADGCYALKEAGRSDPLRHYWYPVGGITETPLSYGSEAPHHDAED
ncbi:MAG: hypothetical protein ACJ0Q1_02020 [Luminiphilus sp.]